MRGSETVKLQRYGLPDRSNKLSKVGAEIEIEHCIIIPRTSSEDPQVLIDGLTVFNFKGVIPEAPDQVFARGKWWDVDGSSGDFRNARGVRKAVQTQLKKVGTGG